MQKKEIGVIGLGKFGYRLALSLMELGHKVVGLDKDEKQVQLAARVLSLVYQGDATDKNVLEQLRFQDLDCVAVSIGHSMEGSILISLNLQDIGVSDIIVKAVGPQHKIVLERLGVRQVVQPEQEAAIQTAHRINNPGMLDLLPISGGVMLHEFIVKKWSGKSLRDLNLPKTKGVMAVAVKSPASEDYTFVPDADSPLQENSALLIIGQRPNVLDLEA